MAKSQSLPEPNRSDREMEFVLRKAKQKRGPEVFRALAAGEPPHAPQEAAPRKRRRSA